MTEIKVIFILPFLFILNNAIGQKVLIEELMQRRSAIYFEELPVHFYDGLLKANPYYPYKGDFLTAQQTSILDREFEKFKVHQRSTELYYIDYYYITKDKMGLLFRRGLGGPEKTIFAAIWDLKDEKITSYIPLAAKYAYEGIMSKTISLIKDIDEDGVLDFLSISYTEQSGLDTFFTNATYEIGRWMASIAEYSFEQVVPVNKDFTWMDLDKNSLDQFYKNSHTPTKQAEHWAILLGSFDTIDEAANTVENFNEIKRAKKREYVYPLEYNEINVFASTGQFLVLMDGFENKNQAAIFLREVKEYIISGATLKDISGTCTSWEYSCAPRCHYYCK